MELTVPHVLEFVWRKAKPATLAVVWHDLNSGGSMIIYCCPCAIRYLISNDLKTPGNDLTDLRCRRINILLPFRPCSYEFDWIGKQCFSLIHNFPFNFFFYLPWFFIVCACAIFVWFFCSSTNCNVLWIQVHPEEIYHFLKKNSW